MSDPDDIYFQALQAKRRQGKTAIEAIGEVLMEEYARLADEPETENIPRYAKAHGCVSCRED